MTGTRPGATGAGQLTPPVIAPRPAPDLARSPASAARDPQRAWRPPPKPEAYLLHGRDAAALAGTAQRVAGLAPSLSDAELRDLACQLGQDRCPPGGPRLGIVASGRDELARLAGAAARLVPSLVPGQLTAIPGVFASNAARGRVVLLFSGLGTGEGPEFPPSGLTDPEAVEPAILHASLTGLRWLDRLGVTATAAIGHSLGEITGLVWAGCLSASEAARLVAQRSAVISASGARHSAMVSVAAGEAAARELCADTGLVIAAHNGPRSHVLAGPAEAAAELVRRAKQQGIRAVVLGVSHGFHSPAMAGCVAPLRSILAGVAFAAPRRRLISTVTGREIRPGDDLVAMLCAGLTSAVRFTEALAAVAGEADLLCETGPGHALATLAASGCDVPAVSLEARTGEDLGAARTAAALFAAGAIHSLGPMLAGRPARPIDIWQERIVVPARSDDDSLSGRFLERIRVHHPSAELVADSRLGRDTDPHLDDYQIDGVAVLPAVLGLEAMSQAASALAGQPLRRAEQVRFDVPVAVRGDVVLRVHARRAAEHVTTVLRGYSDGRWTEHGSAVFRQAEPAPLDPPGPSPAWESAGPDTGILDGTDLYGSVCFQAGRFRRVAFLPELSSHRCRALMRGGDDQPWFGPAVAPLLLGSPGLNDAAAHLPQACFPQRRVRPAGCESVTFSGQRVAGAVDVRAVQRSGTDPAQAPRLAPGLGEAGESVWDVTAVDATGQAVVIWRGLRLADAGPIPGDPALAPSLLGVLLERGASGLGRMDPALRVAVRREQPGCAPAGRDGDEQPPSWPAGHTGWVCATSRGQLGEFSLRLRAAPPAACAWALAGPGMNSPGAGDPGSGALRQRLHDLLAERAPVIAARVATAVECLSTAGRPAGPAGPLGPVGCDLRLDDRHPGGWVLLRAGEASIASVTVRVSGLPHPVAVSIMTGVS